MNTHTHSEYGPSVGTSTALVIKGTAITKYDVPGTVYQAEGRRKCKSLQRESAKMNHNSPVNHAQTLIRLAGKLFRR